MQPLVVGPGGTNATADLVMFFSCLEGATNCRYTLNYVPVTLQLQL